MAKQSNRINSNRRGAYKDKLQSHRLIVRKLSQLTDRLPQPDDAEICDIVVLDLIEGRLDDIVREWQEYFHHNDERSGTASKTSSYLRHS